MKNKCLRQLKIKAYFLLFIMLFQIMLPSVSWALTSGSTQPDFASYEEANTQDMVNLITGDFTYNIPIFEVPSPEGGFHIPLSYHAGIQLEEESSWVGLGWSMNVGAVSRTVNQYADDYEGKVITTSLSGVSANGYINNYILYQDYYDSQKGTGGTFSYGNIFTVGIGSMEGSTSALGISSKDGETHIDALGFASGVTELAVLIGSFGSSGMSQSSANALRAVDFALTSFQSINANRPTNSGSFNISNSDWKSSFDAGFFTSTYSYYLDKNKTEHMFGSLYLNKIDDDGGLESTNTCLTPFIHNNSVSRLINSNYIQHEPARFDNTYLPVSDMHMANNGTGNMAYIISPTSIAYDNYNVMGTGISGRINPFRHEVGSLAYPNLGDNNNHKYNITNFMDYKVNFMYANENANSYTNPLGDNSDNIVNPAYGFDIKNEDYTDDEVASIPSYDCHLWTREDNHIGNSNEAWIQDGRWPNWIITDQTINSEFHPNYISTKRKEANREGLKDNHLASGKFIKWYSNAEILDGTAKSEGFMDFLDDTERTDFRASTSLPAEGIGGFVITREDGLTYHYSLPVYNKKTINNFHRVTGFDFSSINQNMYAYNWLLTGITGSDFVDMGIVGMIDEQDYGYWVKMDYGLFASNYTWRNPYLGVNYSTFSLSENSYEEGVKETYYLNKISTKTHTALFIKSLKSDGKSYFGDRSGIIQNEDPSSALKLDDIVLLSNQDYETLITSSGSGGEGLAPDFNSGNGNSTIGNGDTYNNVLDNYDINSGIQSFLDANQIRKIHFNYSYNLCGKTDNSFDLNSGNAPASATFQIDDSVKKGKLTLEKVDVYGKNNFKVIPPFIFSYGSTTNANENPNYNKNKWDAWGMYSSLAAYSTNSHRASNDGMQWSLQNITTPVGAEISIIYDRDSYSSINGNDMITLDSKVACAINNTNNTIVITDPTMYNQFVIGDILTIKANIVDYFFSLRVIDGNIVPSWYPSNRTETIQVTITGINGNILNISSNILTAINVTSLVKPSPSYIGISKYSSVSYNVTAKLKSKFGGDLRVKEIAIKNENGEILKTKYVYTKDGSENSTTSGVVSYEPDFSREIDFPFYQYSDQPITSVIYSKVSVYSNWGNNNYLTKTEYNFTTPDQNYLILKTKTIHDDQFLNVRVQDVLDPFFGEDTWFTYREKMYQMVFKDYTSRIGSLNSIKIYNKKNQIIKNVNLKYTDNTTNDLPNNQGIYGESTIFSDLTYLPSTNEPALYFRLNRTSKIKFPYILKEIDVTSNGQTITTKNEDFDFITGQPTTVTTTYPYEKQITKVVPAYYKYEDMGSKVDDISNKNMLSQSTAVYNYVSVNGESEKLVNASVQTWNNIWDYTYYNSASTVYNANTETDVWRKYKTYVWKSLIDADGTIPSFTDFVWIGSPNAGWQKTNEVTGYNHYSQPLEAKDILGNYSASKTGYDDNFVVATSGTSNHRSFTHTGFEDLNTSNYFEGRVYINQGNQVLSGAESVSGKTIYSHTGKYLAKIPVSSYGPIYSVNAELQTGKTYRAAVWVHESSPNTTSLVAQLDGTSGGNQYYDIVSMSKNDPKAITAGAWKLLYVNIEVPSDYLPSGGPNNLNDLRIYVSNAGGGSYAYIDDMRLQPVSSPVTGYVYDEKTGLLSTILDNENFATLFTYDGAGRLIKTEKESKKGIKKVSETEYHYGRP